MYKRLWYNTYKGYTGSTRHAQYQSLWQKQLSTFSNNWTTKDNKQYYTVCQKRHQTLAHNFTKY